MVFQILLLLFLTTAICFGGTILIPIIILGKNRLNLDVRLENLCWGPTSNPPNITFETHSDSYIQLSPFESTFCGILSLGLKLSKSIFVGSWSSSPDQSSAQKAGDLNIIRIGRVGLENAMSNIAKQLNKEALRMNGSDIHGIAYASEVYVEVKWLWLILPAVLVVSGIIFVGIVIFQNKKNGESLWKSSVLAFLYHGFYNVDKDESIAVSVMEKKAEELVVRLQASEDGGLILKEEKKLV
ncbi:hypothetical protein PENSTE_c004G00816 [Penicillium steckii]|uniref:Uncharacterized protein n=1 Tax=Penicillium steckii TaxID=303698 RepID=A0A1V6TME4_9EURO|nr:hypothetical protein PENSTE_c004G00816 [Penicillium steckii]